MATKYKELCLGKKAYIDRCIPTSDGTGYTIHRNWGSEPRGTGYKVNDNWSLSLINNNSAMQILHDNVPVANCTVNTTPMCCGILQVGGYHIDNRFQHLTELPEDVELELIILLKSVARWSFNKGVLQSYFYRRNFHDTTYDHKMFLHMFEKYGKQNQEEIYNPNSGNIVKGYSMQSKAPTPAQNPARQPRVARAVPVTAFDEAVAAS